MEVDLTQMSFGDIAFTGLGHNSTPVSIGLEIKSLGDCISCVQSGRFAGHQLPGLIQSYDHIWLLIQGQYKMRPKDGALIELREGRGGGQYWTEAGGGQRRWMWRDFEGWVNSVSILGGLRVHRVATWEEGADWIKCLYGWFQREGHSSTQVVYGGKQLYAEQALLVRPTLARRVAKELPSVGVVRSAAVAAKFRTLESMVMASEKDWQTVDGLGAGTAKKIYLAIHGLNGNGSKGH
jgi:ERCC4-type nuclease